MGFLSFLLYLIFASSAYSCPLSTTCATTNTTAIEVRFPFGVANQQPGNCSYPGFDLYCRDQGFTALTLPHSGKFLVRYINYETQSIQLYDPGNCMPQRFLDGFDLSGSPFEADRYVNYTFLRCPRNFTDAHYTVIDCLSNSTTSVMTTSKSIFAHNKSCENIGTFRVPNSLPEGLTSNLSDDIWISWDVPDCKQCEVEGGICGLENNSSKQIGCFHAEDPGVLRDTGEGKGINKLKIIAIAIAVPAIGITVFAAIYLCNLAFSWVSSEMQLVVIPQPEEAPTGLDQATIDSYTKVVLGNSCRVPGLNDGSCPICLSDYIATEILRCIPDCRHCFHADCIDEWFKMNATCPVCRVSLAHPLQVSTS